MLSAFRFRSQSIKQKQRLQLQGHLQQGAVIRENQCIPMGNTKHSMVAGAYPIPSVWIARPNTLPSLPLWQSSSVLWELTTRSRDTRLPRTMTGQLPESSWSSLTWWRMTTGGSALTPCCSATRKLWWGLLPQQPKLSSGISCYHSLCSLWVFFFAWMWYSTFPIRPRLLGELTARNTRPSSLLKLDSSAKTMRCAWSSPGTSFQLSWSAMPKCTTTNHTNLNSNWRLFIKLTNSWMYNIWFSPWFRLSDYLRDAAQLAGMAMSKAKNAHKQLKLTVAFASEKSLNIVLETPKVGFSYHIIVWKNTYKYLWRSLLCCSFNSWWSITKYCYCYTDDHLQTGCGTSSLSPFWKYSCWAGSLSEQSSW